MWFKKNWESRIKEERKKAEVLKDPAKSQYIPVSAKRTKAARAFGRVFRKIFESYRKGAEKRVEELSNEREQAFLDDRGLDYSLDFVFNDCIYSTFASIREGKTEEETLQKGFDSLEAQFKEKYQIQNGFARHVWRKGIFKDICLDLYKFSFDNAFSRFYDEAQFSNMLEKSEDTALDTIFLKLIVTEHYFPNDIGLLEVKMENAFNTILHEEFEKLCLEIGLQKKVETLMENILDRKFKKFGVEYYKENGNKVYDPYA